MAIILRATETVQNSAPFTSKASPALTRAIVAAAVGSIASLVFIFVLLVFLCLRRVNCTLASDEHDNGAPTRGRYKRDDGTTLRPTWPKGPWRSSEETEKVTWVEFLRRDQLLADRKARHVFRWRRRSAVREEQHIIPRYASPEQSLNSSSKSSDTISWLPVQTPLASIVIEQLAPGRTLLSELSPTHGASAYHSRFLKDQLFRDLLNPSFEQPRPLIVTPAQIYTEPRCVNPSEVEHEPNPVIFGHLLLNSPERSAFARSPTLELPEPSAQQFALEMAERNYRYESSGAYAYPESSNVGILPTASPGNSSSTHGSTPRYSPMLSSEASPSESAETVSPSSTFSGEGASPLAQYDTNADQACKCRTCGLIFRTAGLQRIHYNRKHNHRYICQECDKSFGLRKDLERHELSVHQKHLSSTPAHTCPNEGCATPGKKFPRKDNWRRHVNKCKETLAVKAMRR